MGGYGAGYLGWQIRTNGFGSGDGEVGMAVFKAQVLS